MIFAIILLGTLSIVFIAIGFLIWKKEKISLLHDYHYNHVAEKDKKTFCTLSGIGIISIGIGMTATAVILAFTDSVAAFIALAVGFAIGLTLLAYATSKYNSR